MKKILILGGTQFIGRNLVESLQMLGGYELTLFNRQQTQASLFQEVMKIKGDRETSDVQLLGATDWDYVIDLSCYFPDSLELLLDRLRGRVNRYIFISTLSVYSLDTQQPDPINEASSILPCTAAQKSDRTSASYGNRKAECERVLQRAEWLDKLVLRASLVYGKYDHTDRFYYWLYRARHQLPLILPDGGRDTITLTYVGDLVEMIVRSLSLPQHSEVYNATTHEPCSLQELVSTLDKRVTTVSLDSSVLHSRNIRPALDIPLWFNASLKVSNERLRSDFSMDFTPFNESVELTAQYYQSLQWPVPGIGLNNEEIIALEQIATPK